MVFWVKAMIGRMRKRRKSIYFMEGKGLRGFGRMTRIWEYKGDF